MKPVVALIRIAMSLFVLVAVAATYRDTASRVPVNLLNFFGYFTLQSNIIAAVVMIVTASVTLRGLCPPYWLGVVRAAWTTYMVIVGLVYNILLVGTPGGGGVSLPWANVVLHIVFPLYCLLDWLAINDRPRLVWRHLWWVLLYPAVWMAVVLIRGATDGWVPYPFLDPDTGYVSVFLHAAGIAVVVILVGAAVFVVTRLRESPHDARSVALPPDEHARTGQGVAQGPQRSEDTTPAPRPEAAP